MQITERMKWDVRHQIGAVMSGIYAKIEPDRKQELNDQMLAGAYYAGTTNAWIQYLCARFDVDLSEVWIDERVWGTSERVDSVLQRTDWHVLKAAVEEIPSLIKMLAKQGPLPPEYAPPDVQEHTPDWLMPVPTGHMIPVPSLRTLWTSQSELIHGADQRFGNVILFRREPVIDLLTGRSNNAPFISGNSIRHSWRAIATDGLYLMLGIEKGEVDPELHHALTSGGVIDAGSEMAKVDPALRAAVRHLFPAFELLGGIVEKQVCHGAWNVHDAMLVCRENATRLMDPTLYPPPPGTESHVSAMADAAGEAARRETRVAYARALQEHFRPANDYMTLRQYTKHIDPDVAMKGDDNPDPKKRAKRHMLWDTEVVRVNAQWVHHCRIHATATKFARSCVSWIFREFADHPYLTAANGKGHGLISYEPYKPADDSQRLPDAGAFCDHIDSQREAIKEWLRTGRVPQSMRNPPPMTTEEGCSSDPLCPPEPPKQRGGRGRKAA